MSQLLNFTATGTIGPATGGFRMGGITIVAGTANAVATLTEVIAGSTFTRMSLAAPANSMNPHPFTDTTQGAVFMGTLILSTLTGAGASINVEEM